MIFSEILMAQLADPFRIGLCAALVFTMLRTRAATGMIVPLLAGLVFVAVILPSTMGAANPAPFQQQLLAGLVSNAVILGVLLGAWALYQRLRG